MKTRVVSTQACKYTTQVHKSTSKRFPEWRKDFLRRRLQRPTLLDLAPLPCLAASDVTNHKSTNEYKVLRSRTGINTSINANNCKKMFGCSVWCNQAQKYQRVQQIQTKFHGVEQVSNTFYTINLTSTEYQYVRTITKNVLLSDLLIWYKQWPK